MVDQGGNGEPAYLARVHQVDRKILVEAMTQNSTIVIDAFLMSYITSYLASET